MQHIARIVYWFLILFVFGSVLFQDETRAQGNKVTVLTQEQLASELGNRYFDAVDYLIKNSWMADTLIEQKINPALAYGIIFPGLVRYSALRDIMEAGAYRTLYVQRGRKYAHYTVGRFQMKPSFAELIERNVTRQKMTSFEFDLKNNSKARSLRAKRLESTEWQLRYLVFFIRIMEKRFNHVKWKSEDDKVRFYATAFNVGYNRDERTIRRMMNPRTPRYRKAKKTKAKDRHGDVAAYFYNLDGHRFTVKRLEDEVSIQEKTAL
ncbi:MAG: hypothetical protein KUL83_11055 [Lentimicrobium sp.]|jgi:hypothetical protein|nr:hypothetical protein [Lentimicrobium sp.]MDD2529003.1 hypothetical protein [Lentimicrobiaceae bacterium]MDD4597252.1 hypothetical protein [Lentimicrobiaceae bacterium]MDY0026361.1 hypothetical protein [Lentimicrobium sp.]HAH56558.1 hypothetical protein [Bacteroidales bacterium]